MKILNCRFSNWMHNLDDKTRLYNLYIPGYKIPSILSIIIGKGTPLGLALYSGIRYIESINNKTYLDTVCRFLDSHPTELIIVGNLPESLFTERCRYFHPSMCVGNQRGKILVINGKIPISKYLCKSDRFYGGRYLKTTEDALGSNPYRLSIFHTKKDLNYYNYGYIYPGVYELKDNIGCSGFISILIGSNKL